MMEAITMPALCFDQEKFALEDFSVDKFVSEYRRYAPLENFLEDLNVYHKILCSAMVELINKDYADFVNLSSNLVGLDKSINSLTIPLENVKSEIENVKNSLDETLESARFMFSEKVAVHKMKVLIHHAVCVLEGLKKIEDLNALSADAKPLSSEVLERIALDFNLVQFHMSKISGTKFLVPRKTEEVLQVAQNIEMHLECMFLKSLSCKDIQNLQKVLRIYSVVSKEREVENCFCQAVVKPFMRKHITQGSITKHGLAKVFDDILDFIPTFCEPILKVTRGSKRQTEIIPGYDFLVNAVWPEVVLCFDYIAPVYIYAPGDPLLFHQNYSASMNFLERFEHFCQVQTSVTRLRNHTSYKQFLKKWNLDVYFQIRFQEIAGKLENSLLGKPHDMELANDKNSQYLLNASFTLWTCVNLCWDDKIFLLPLSSNFWRITLQLVSRYRTWAYSAIKMEDKGEVLPPVKSAILVRDVERLISELEPLFYDILHQKLHMKEINSIKLATDETLKSLEDIPPLAGTLMVQSLTKQCCSHLRLIADIPRLYRKTNREVPSKPSGYVASVLNSLTEFLSETNSILSEDWRKRCLQEVTEGIVMQCVVMIRDVLTSIKKMENSLKILKRARDKPVGQATSGAITDDDKIRRQLVIDVNSLEELVRKTGLQIENVKNFKELKDLVTSAERISEFLPKA